MCRTPATNSPYGATVPKRHDREQEDADRRRAAEARAEARRVADVVQALPPGVRDRPEGGAGGHRQPDPRQCRHLARELRREQELRGVGERGQRRGAEPDDAQRGHAAAAAEDGERDAGDGDEHRAPTRGVRVSAPTMRW